MAPSSGLLPIGGMAWMYLLMSMFHLSPGLKLASRRAGQIPPPVTQVEGDRPCNILSFLMKNGSPPAATC